MFCHFYHHSLNDFLALTPTQTRRLLAAIPTSSEWSEKFGKVMGD
jgi:hypothetical protein